MLLNGTQVKREEIYSLGWPLGLALVLVPDPFATPGPVTEAVTTSVEVTGEGFEEDERGRGLPRVGEEVVSIGIDEESVEEGAPEPPAAADNWANPTDGGLERNTE